MSIYSELQTLLDLIISAFLYLLLATKRQLGAFSHMDATDSIGPSEQRSNLVDSIEHKTKRTVGIDFSEHDAYGKFNEQEASPLFSVLPRELRDHIWAYATAPYEDSNEKFEETSYYYRPYHTARLKTDTSILLTCRRAWLEANAMPMLQAEHSFYYHRPAPDKRDPEWTARLTEHNRQNFGHLHLFAQMYAIEGLRANKGRLRGYFLKGLAVAGDFQPRMLHVTVRHTDWWYWEDEAPLRLQDGWVKAMLDSPDLRSTQTFKLELETLDYKVDQLAPILERLKGMVSEEMETHVVAGKPAKTKFVLTGEPETCSWEGPANIDNQQFGPYADRSTLKYHVVTLTWKLRFPDIPNGFVPRLRRAPRIGAEREAGPFGGAGRLDRKHWVLPRGMHQAPRARSMRPPGRLTRKRKADERAEDMARYYRMQGVERAVQQQSRDLAELHEGVRRRHFEDYGERQEVERWEAQWETQKSLLKFVDDSK
ncbi:hypothetical protein LTR85_002017 [Meristemomyces frigidus]|nr:hypothetical protein LTR85_002017 [Meristemomyces frigidus]